MNEETIGYRLDSIEETLRQLKDLLVTTQRQQDQIDILQKNQYQMQSTLDDIKVDIQELRVRPAMQDSKRWQYILDYIFKALVAAGVGALLVTLKLGN